MVHILTSSGNILRVEVRPQDPQVGDSAITVNLRLSLKQKMSSPAFLEQQGYLDISAMAAYVSLNKIDQRNRFKASVNLTSKSSDGLNLLEGSTSSGLGFTLALFNSFWTKQLNKGLGFTSPIFATGEVLNSGDIKAIGHLEQKLQSTILFAQENDLSNFVICIPKANEREISPSLLEKIQQNGGKVIATNRIQELLGKLLGNEYDGDPLGRWEPFKGLKSFEYEDSLRFYGRKKDVERLYEDLERNQGILIVSGPTSSGKSSLIKAGLIPLLVTQQPNLSWLSITPSEISQSIISIVLAGLFRKSVHDNELQIIESKILENQTSAFEYLKALLTDRNNSFLLHIDQFEEFFKQDLEQSYLDEIVYIQALTKQFSQIKVVFSLRDDDLSRLIKIKGMESPKLSNLSSTLSVESLREIVIEQAAFSGISFEKNLAEKIIDDATKVSNVLPVVEFVLTELYETAKSETTGNTVLKFQNYTEIGCLEGAIASRAESILNDLAADELTIHHFFSMLIGITNEGKVYAKEFELAHKPDVNVDGFLLSIEVSDELTELIKRFGKANLLNLKKDNNYSIKLIHESLLTQWPRLSEWIKEKQDQLIFIRSIQPEFNEWKESGRDFDKLKPSLKIGEGLVALYYDQIPDKLLQHYIFLSFRKWFFQTLFGLIPIIMLVILLLLSFSNSTFMDINVPIIFDAPNTEPTDES